MIECVTDIAKDVSHPFLAALGNELSSGILYLFKSGDEKKTLKLQKKFLRQCNRSMKYGKSFEVEYSIRFEAEKEFPSPYNLRLRCLKKHEYIDIDGKDNCPFGAHCKECGFYVDFRMPWDINGFKKLSAWVQSRLLIEQWNEFGVSRREKNCTRRKRKHG